MNGRGGRHEKAGKAPEPVRQRQPPNPPPNPPRQPLESRKPTEIRFHDSDKPYYEFTSYSPHPIRYNNKDYPTSEHLFQSLKVGISRQNPYTRPEIFLSSKTPKMSNVSGIARPHKMHLQPPIKWMDESVKIGTGKKS